MTDIAAAILCVGLCFDMTWVKYKKVPGDLSLEAIIATLAALKVLL